jgi:tRNA A37 N6-isopentenylltransferase MiaA
LEEATELIRRSHRQYARRQTTWFRHQLPEGATILDGTTDYDSQVEKVCSLWTERTMTSA